VNFRERIYYEVGWIEPQRTRPASKKREFG
jgi:hypothetical protein